MKLVLFKIHQWLKRARTPKNITFSKPPLPPNHLDSNSPRPQIAQISIKYAQIYSWNIYKPNKWPTALPNDQTSRQFCHQWLQKTPSHVLSIKRAVASLTSLLHSAKTAFISSSLAPVASRIVSMIFFGGIFEPIVCRKTLLQEPIRQR